MAKLYFHLQKSFLCCCHSRKVNNVLFVPFLLIICTLALIIVSQYFVFWHYSSLVFVLFRFSFVDLRHFAKNKLSSVLSSTSLTWSEQPHEYFCKMSEYYTLIVLLIFPIAIHCKLAQFVTLGLLLPKYLTEIKLWEKAEEATEEWRKEELVPVWL